ncbi:MAG TPA: tetratricopeptide repeat protein [Halanaerobiales bacterium]|nr:tetratricopeptide repeat protein [Halanaerobiales bacterium]
MLEEKYINKLDDELQKKYKEASDLLDIGEFAEAKEKFNDILEVEEKFIPILNKLAVIEIYHNNLEKAEEIIKDILKEDPEYVPAITNLGSIAKKKGNLEKAERFYEKAIEIDPDYGNAYNNLGVIYREQGKYTKSVRYLKKARKRGSYSFKFDDEPLYKNKGCLFFVAVIVIAILYFVLT